MSLGRHLQLHAPNELILGFSFLNDRSMVRNLLKLEFMVGDLFHLELHCCFLLFLSDPCFLVVLAVLFFGETSEKEVDDGNL